MVGHESAPEISTTEWVERPIEQIELIGGAVCLDFANSVGGTRQEPKDKLHDYEDLVRWAAHAGAIDRDEVAPLLAEAAQRPGEAAAVLARAGELREAIYRIFSALAQESGPPAADIERLNDELARGLPHLRIEPAEYGFDYRFAADDRSLDRPLWPIAHSASELLAEGDLARLKQCTSHDCDWLFVDLSKNKSRRWCDMRDCGNRAKARRYYLRQKRAGGSSVR